MNSYLDVVPAPHRDAAHVALTQVAERRAIGPISLLKGGISGALIYRVECAPQTLVLRIEPSRIALEHRLRGYACMRAAAAIGVAPQLHFAEATTGIAIMDFIAPQPIATHRGGRLGLVTELGALIARVQTTQPFPSLFGANEDLLSTLLRSLAASGRFAPGLLDRHHDELARIRSAIPWNPTTLVSSHNDPNPRNLLYDGARIWLVDWELASSNDRLFDLAIATMEIADTPALEAALLTAAFGHSPGAALRARLRVMKCLARLFYGCIALTAVTAGHAQRSDNLTALSPAQFHAAASQGHLAPAEIGDAFGKMSLAAFIDGCSADDFEQSLALVRLFPQSP